MTNQSSHTEPEQVAAPKRPAHAKGPSKQDQLIKLLSRKQGADTATISSKLGWQPHTTRAALSGLRKVGFDITKESAGAGKPTRYRIVKAPNAAVGVEVTDGQ